jgi:ribosomal protein S18 acetylase RimI-like enzyme
VTTIRKAVPADLPAISRVLSRAFHDDPPMRWAIPDQDRRRRLLPRFFELFAMAFQQHDEIYVTSDAAGAALWAPPGGQPVHDEAADGFARGMAALAAAGAARVVEVGALLDEHHPHGSFWYLQFVGVEPERQGRGIGSELLAPVLRRCDREGVPAYLEASSVQSKRLYERHGFEERGVLAPAGGPPLWPMWRG